LCGKAAATQLAAGGLRVVCVEPENAARQAVGESLDWSAPDLFSALGLPMEDLVKAGMATWKRHVTVKLRDGASAHYVPGAWLAEAPFHVELRTLHVDRLRLDEELLKRTVASGVTMVRDTVVRVERNGDRLLAVHTADGSRLPCCRANSTFPRFSSVRRRSRFGLTLLLPKRWKGRLCTWTQCQRNISTGFGKFRSARRWRAWDS
jgi:flavin-dependent dehydrogenase